MKYPALEAYLSENNKRRFPKGYKLPQRLNAIMQEIKKNRVLGEICVPVRKNDVEKCESWTSQMFNISSMHGYENSVSVSLDTDTDGQTQIDGLKSRLARFIGWEGKNEQQRITGIKAGQRRSAEFHMEREIFDNENALDDILKMVHDELYRKLGMYRPQEPGFYISAKPDCVNNQGRIHVIPHEIWVPGKRRSRLA